MLELDLSAHRGPFRIELACHLEAPLTVFFGPSGAGKSSLLRLIAGLDRLDSGLLRLDKTLLAEAARNTHLPPGQRKITLAAQQPALFPHLTVAQNVAYGLAGINPDTQQRIINDSLALVGAEHLLTRKPQSLSGGEAQRVSLARAIAPSPRLLLLDEPLSALDAVARDQVLGQLLPQLLERKIQTILVTHDAADALTANAEVLVLHEGRVIAQGPATEVLAGERARLRQRLG
uniref:Putative ABC-type Fe3+ transport system, ATPase component n=1 Tax=mine drainage metagenome TaxID=410659 RepID=E6QN50_9ZZZZ